MSPAGDPVTVLLCRLQVVNELANMEPSDEKKNDEIDFHLKFFLI